MDAGKRRWWGVLLSKIRTAVRRGGRTTAAVILGGVLAGGGIFPLELALDNAARTEFVTKPPLVHRTTTALTETASSVARALLAAGTAVEGGVTSAASAVSQTLTPPGASSDFHIVTDKVRAAFFNSTIPFGNIILGEAKKNGLAPELVAAVIKQESKFNPSARSRAGAIGLMQLLPATGRWMGARDLLSPQQNIAAGVRYLRYLSDQFGSDEKNVIAACNACEGNVRRFGGLPPFHETQTYVRNVLTFQHEFQNDVALRVAAALPSQPSR